MIGWTADGGSVYVVNGEIPASIYRLDVPTGRRQLWKAIVPPERTKIISNIVLSPDGKSYAYSYTYELNDLYLADGLK